MNNLNILFLLMTMISTVISISSTSWLGAWMGLEINMLSFIPLITQSKNIICNEAALKYFIIQAMASSLFISFCLLNSFNSMLLMEFNSTFYFSLILSAPLILKLGAAPFQAWFISVLEGLPWMKYFILMTWQKIAPLFIISFFLKNINIILFWSTFSLVTGAIMGLNQTSLKKILAYSSVNHMGWMISSLLMNKFFMIFYLMVYIILNFLVISFLMNNMNKINQILSTPNSLMFSISIMSLGGLPPLLGFLPKWLILQNLLLTSFIFLPSIMIFLALITLFFYSRMMFSNIMMNFSQNWSSWNNHNSPTKNINNYLVIMINLTTLFIFNLFM